ncbi:tetratricopeptide repeat protein [uncultured Chitinophaga sp.]|uniref:tetratricopeptide repeat protein n=1 Tax=uncultured Chitinophaga sp. TaxID=339340 RepID=UPI0025F3EB0F|nr:tetratricopeptide repeat protein [uncultured Chitinophaga sp.]
MTRLFTINTLALLLLTTVAAFAQSSNKYIRQGNELYKKKQYADAEASYKKAVEKNQASVEGNYNMGNSMYEQKRFEDARKQYASSAKLAPTKLVKGDANYNTGNTFMEEKKWEESIKSYKAALKANPQDEQARYNLAYAQQMLKQQQQQNKDNKDNKDKKDQKDNKDKKDDKKDQDKDKDKKDQDKDKKDQDKKDDEKQDKPDPMPSKLSQQEAENLLKALAQEEKKLQDKAKKIKGRPVAVEKDW